MDLIDHLQITDNTGILNSGQHEAGAIMLLICDSNYKLITEWYNISCNYHLIDDGVSKLPNLPNFIEHRHDQSVFSILTKKNKIYPVLSTNECVYCIRNLTGKSTINLETFTSNRGTHINKLLIIFLLMVGIISNIFLLITRYN